MATEARCEHSSEEWGVFEGKKVSLWKYKNCSGNWVTMSDWGGRIKEVCIRDRNGRMRNVTLGWGLLSEYVAENGGTYYGALVGRYANRIGKGKFTLNGKEYTLDLNNAPGGVPCSLHGGNRGFALRRWECAGQQYGLGDDGRMGTRLRIKSPDGEGGFPGNVEVVARVTFNNDNVLRFEWEAKTDADTPMSFTNHSYWNLDGVTEEQYSALDNELMINADKFTPYGPDMIPTGELRDVEGTPFDFRTPRKISERHDDDCELLKIGCGYDINWAIRKWDGRSLRHAATLASHKTGIKMEVWTKEPGLQVYDGYWLPEPNAGIALETQRFPDSPNRPEFPNCIVKAGETFKTVTEYRFSTF